MPNLKERLREARVSTGLTLMRAGGMAGSDGGRRRHRMGRGTREAAIGAIARAMPRASIEKIRSRYDRMANLGRVPPE